MASAHAIIGFIFPIIAIIVASWLNFRAALLYLLTLFCFIGPIVINVLIALSGII